MKMMMRPFFFSSLLSYPSLSREEKKCVTSAQSSGIVNGQGEILAALERCRVERKQTPRSSSRPLLFLLELHGRAENNISFSRFLSLVVVVLAFCYFKPPFLI